MIYQDILSGDLHQLLQEWDDTPTKPVVGQVDPLTFKRNRDLRHALHRIGQAKQHQNTQTTFRHNQATLSAVHAALRQLGYHPSIQTPSTSSVRWAPPV